MLDLSDLWSTRRAVRIWPRDIIQCRWGLSSTCYLDPLTIDLGSRRSSTSIVAGSRPVISSRSSTSLLHWVASCMAVVRRPSHTFDGMTSPTFDVYTWTHVAHRLDPAGCGLAAVAPRMSRFDRIGAEWHTVIATSNRHVLADAECTSPPRPTVQPWRSVVLLDFCHLSTTPEQFCLHVLFSKVIIHRFVIDR